MDIEKICASLRVLPTTEELLTAEKALYALQAENEKLRTELEKEAAARKKQADILCELRGQKYEQMSVIDRLRSELNDLRTQWDMYGGDEGITSTFAELEQARAEITRLKHYEDKRHDCPIVCAKREIIKAHEELEAAQNERDMWREGMEDCQQSILELEAELEEAKRNQCLGADCPWRHTAI